MRSESQNLRPFLEHLYPFSPLVRIKKEFSSNKSKLSVVSVKPVTPRLPTAFIKQKQTGDMFSVLLARGCLGCSFFTMLLPITWNGLRVCFVFFSCPVVTPGRLPQHCKLPAWFHLHTCPASSHVSPALSPPLPQPISSFPVPPVLHLDPLTCTSSASSLRQFSLYLSPVFRSPVHLLLHECETHRTLLDRSRFVGQEHTLVVTAVVLLVVTAIPSVSFFFFFFVYFLMCISL